ncbi:PRTase-like protein [Dothidotthia symphoricarpi CBS 119687]|uniref:PRTase-like protein n=1 Tax=Dothidotthia symphoricarpi CBS 119687 TaxID=1392245 RepID=A0A6A5ZXI9_9PLEO|nr:PRTase-like protein [Dothidotthia symphoricarpi CBS 119687]KAF2123487.1 PRTase-like protein [Dothidotthia symphoricarpi CBS 119687]
MPSNHELESAAGSSQHEAPVITLLSSNSTIQSLFPTFLDSSITEATMHQVVQSMTVELVVAAKKEDPSFNSIPVTLVPILRGALPMYVAASQHFADPFCVLVRGFRAQEKSSVRIDWLGRRPIPLVPKNGHIVLLDTVIATGGTILKICDELMAISGSAERHVTILSCYVSPIGLAAVAKHPLVRNVIVAATAERVDEHGYVVPYPGDVGDKLFGRAEARN